LKQELETLVKQRIADMTFDDVVFKQETLTKLRSRMTDEDFKRLFSKSNLGLTEDIIELKDTNVFNQLTERDSEVKELRADIVGMFSSLVSLLDNLAEGNLNSVLYKGRKTLEV